MYQLVGAVARSSSIPPARRPQASQPNPDADCRNRRPDYRRGLLSGLTEPPREGNVGKVKSERDCAGEATAGDNREEVRRPCRWMLARWVAADRARPASHWPRHSMAPRYRLKGCSAPPLAKVSWVQSACQPSHALLPSMNGDGSAAQVFVTRDRWRTSSHRHQVRHEADPDDELRRREFRTADVPQLMGRQVC